MANFKPISLTDPADTLTEWATSGGADKARPSTGSFNTGWLAGGSANFNSDINYAFEQLCAGAKFNSKLTAVDTALMNIQFEHQYDRTFANFSGSGEADLAYIRWDDLAEKWLCVFADDRVAGTSTSRVWWAVLDDISDWGSLSTNLFNRFTETDFWGQRTTPMWSDGTIAAFGVDGATQTSAFCTLALDGLSAISINTNAYNSITRPYDLFWDQNSSRWFVLGHDEGGLSYIESSNDSGATWTTELSAPAASDLVSFATNQQGSGLAVCTNGDTYYVQSNNGLTGTWNQDVGTITAAVLGNTVRFIEHREANTVTVNNESHFVIQTGASTYIQGAAYTTAAELTGISGVNLMIPGRDFMLFCENSPSEWKNLANFDSKGAYIVENTGYYLHDRPDVDVYSSTGGDYRAGGGQMAFLWDDTQTGGVQRLAYSTYGPKLED